MRGQRDKMFIMLLKACQLRVCISQIQIRKQAATKVGHDAAGCMLCLSASLSRCPSVCRLSVQIKESEREREIYEPHLVAPAAKSLWLSY